MSSVPRSGEAGDAAIAAGDHDGEMVGDDVVHLAGDPGAFSRRGECALLVPLAFQPLSAVVQFGEVGAAGAAATMREAKIASYHQPPPANRSSPATTVSSSRPAHTRASRRGRIAATVYRAMSRARPLTAWT